MHKQTYIALLRGINVGGHHKVPMAELRSLLERLGFENVSTLLNSGNVVFQTTENEGSKLEKLLVQKIGQEFGFEVPVMVRRREEIEELMSKKPFKAIETHKDIRL